MRTGPPKSTHLTRELSPKQAKVMASVASEIRGSEAARQAEVDRLSSYHWHRTLALFAAEVNGA